MSYATCSQVPWAHGHLRRLTFCFLNFALLVKSTYAAAGLFSWPTLEMTASLYFSDDPATWAVLLAACHAENTVVCLHNVQPKRTNLGKMIVATISAKSKAFVVVYNDLYNEVLFSNFLVALNVLLL